MENFPLFCGLNGYSLVKQRKTRVYMSKEQQINSGMAHNMLSAGTTLIQYFADEVELSALVFWTFGDLGSTGLKDLAGTAALLAFFFLYCILHRWDYNALLSGEALAQLDFAGAGGKFF